MSEIKAIAFDVFGTLCTGNHSKSPYRQLQEYFHLPWNEFRHQVLCTANSPTQTVVNLVGADVIGSEGRAVIAKIEIDIKEDCKRLRLFEDAVATLTLLQEQKIPYGLISNLAKPYGASFIHLLGEQGLLPTKELCLWSYGEGIAKPDAEMFRRFSQRAGLDVSEVLVVGDKIENDLNAARTAGCQSRLVCRDEELADGLPAGSVIQDLKEIAGIVNLKVSRPVLEVKSSERIARPIAVAF